MIVIGLMSGTSADGIDAVLCHIRGAPGHLKVEIVQGRTYPYDAALRQRILRACDVQRSRVDEIAVLHTELAERFAQCALDLIDEASRARQPIDLIGSHGHTLWHHVQPDGQVIASLQIAEAAVIAERTGITTISNMRARDIAAGGQGAPLTSYIDWLLLRHPQRWRAVQNIGGMGNVTFLPPLDDTDNPPVAFDTGPGNALLDAAVEHFTSGKQIFDSGGRLAKQGRVDEEWLETLLKHPYGQRQYPKTTGRETFGASAAMKLVDEGLARGLTQSEIIATLTALTAGSIAQAYQRFAPAPIQEVILGGGGRHNPVMVGMLQGLLAPAKVLTHEDIGLDSDFKEAMVFALLAYETWHGRPGALPALTGAKSASILGQITPGGNYGQLLRKTKG